MEEDGEEPIQLIQTEGHGIPQLTMPIEDAYPGCFPIEQTLCIIKPDAIEHAEEIINILRREGFAILQSRRVELNAEQISEFYQDQHMMPWFSETVEYMHNKPILALLLAGPGAILHLNTLLGPQPCKDRQNSITGLRNRFGTPGSDIKNGLHSSLTEEDAMREIHIFFPDRVIEPILTGNLASYYLNEYVHPTLNLGLTELVRARPSDPVIWLADWLFANNPNKPRELGDIICKVPEVD